MQHKAPYCSNRTCAARPYTHPKHLAQDHITRLAQTQYFLRYYAESCKPTAPATLITSADAALAAKSPAELLLLMRVLQLLLAYTRAPEKKILGLPIDAYKSRKAVTLAQRYVGAQGLGNGWHETWTDISDAALATGLKESEIYGGKKSVLRGKCLWEPILRSAGAYEGEEKWDGGDWTPIREIETSTLPGEVLEMLER